MRNVTAVLLVLLVSACGDGSTDSDEPATDASVDGSDALTPAERQQKIENCQSELEAWYDGQKAAYGDEDSALKPPREPDSEPSQIETFEGFPEWCSQFGAFHCGSCIDAVNLDCEIEATENAYCD